MSMTTETSNARGDVPYDRDLIARMLDVCGHPKFTMDAYMEQARLLRAADNADAANVGTVAARGDVRGLDRLGWVRRDAIERLRNDLDVTGVMVHDEERTDSVPVYLAAEGVQAGEVDGEALARRFHETYERLAPSFGYEKRTETREFDPESANGRLMIAVCASLSQQPEARGVVARTLDDWHEDNGPVVWWRIPVNEPAWIGTPNDSDWPGYHTHWTPHPEVPSALTGERNG